MKWMVLRRFTSELIPRITKFCRIRHCLGPFVHGPTVLLIGSTMQVLFRRTVTIFQGNRYQHRLDEISVVAEKNGSRWPLEVTLPFELDVPLRTYLDHAYPLGILWNSRGFRAQVCNFYINVAFPDARIDPSMIKVYASQSHRVPLSHSVCMTPSVELEHWRQMGFLEVETYDTTFIEDHSEHELLNLLLTKLKVGYYGWVCSDDYWIPRHKTPVGRHWGHVILLTGYSEKLGTFFGPTYLSDGGYSYLQVSRSRIAKSLRSQIKRLQPDISCVRLRKPGPKIPLEKSIIKKQLGEYLAGSSSSGQYPWFAVETALEPAHYGVKYYDALAVHLRLCARKRIRPDLRFSRLFWEHKKMMLSRFSFLQLGLRRGEAEGVRNALSLVEKDVRYVHHMAHLACLENSLTDLCAIAGRLTKIETMETEALSRWFTSL